MRGSALLERVVAAASLRLLLILVAAILLTATAALLAAALALALVEVLPLWAALGLTALLLLAGAAIAIACMLTGRKPPAAHSNGAAAAFGLGEALGAALHKRPKTTLAVALVVGVILGADPALRRDVIDILTRNGERRR